MYCPTAWLGCGVGLGIGHLRPAVGCHGVVDCVYRTVSKAPGRRWAAERRGLAPGPRAWLPLAGCWLASYAVSTTGMAPLAGALTCTGSWAGELAADTGAGRQQQWADDLGHGDRAG